MSNYFTFHSFVTPGLTRGPATFATVEKKRDPGSRPG